MRILSSLSSLQTAGEPLVPDEFKSYEEWLAWKFSDYPKTTKDLIVKIRDPLALTRAEHESIRQRCRKANMAIYTCTSGVISSKDTVRLLGKQLGLRRLDSNLCADRDNISSVRVMSSGRQQEYIPYTDHPLNWHTDGYYNRPDRRIRAFVMHCVRDAATGGDNTFLDPEIVYALMRAENPDYVAALMQPDAMTIPANVSHGVEIRHAETGPVFSFESVSARLHMRYTARKRYIQWNKDPVTNAAARFLEHLLTHDAPHVFRHHLMPGQGIICNNVLHGRTAFKDHFSMGRKRLLYRARYYDRVAGT